MHKVIVNAVAPEHNAKLAGAARLSSGAPPVLFVDFSQSII
jgi:hypothetical protein